MRAAPLLLLALAAVPAPARARVVTVGPGGEVPTLAAGVAAARAGDTLRLAAGEYFECASITRPNLVIEGAGPATVVTDRTCEGKALLVVHADNLTLRDLTLARARVGDGNGAGVRLEGQGLTLERVRFENDQVGLLAGMGGPGRVRVVDCVFHSGGVAGERPTAALNVGAVAALEVRGSVFEDVKGGQIVSSAERTELTGNRIATGVEEGAGPAVLVWAGALLMRDNVLQLGPHAPPRDAAVMANGDAAELRGNTLENTTGHAEVLLLDWMHGSPVLSGNVVPHGDEEVSSSGMWRHRAGDMARDMAGGLRGMAGSVKHALLGR